MVIFESFSIFSLREVADELYDGSVSHFRDSYGLECDVVVHSKDGRYGLIEIKLGSDNDTIEEAAANLLTLYDKMDPEKMKLPAFMAILCGNAPYAYRREDGVYVVPIGCLRP